MAVASTPTEGRRLWTRGKVMRLAEVSITGFRGFRDRVTVPIDSSLTAIIGRNDSGKSTILQALDYYFNDRKMVKDDYTVGGEGAATVECCFDELPDELIIDSQASTTLAGEYLLDSEGRLRIRKVWRGNQVPKCYVVCDHPLLGDESILNLTIAKLRDLAREMRIEEVDDGRVASAYRSAIWASAIASGQCVISSNVAIELVKDSGKEIIGAISREYPRFYLFTSDRALSDEDKVAQDPIRLVVDTVLSEYSDRLEALAKEVTGRIETLLANVAQEMHKLAPSVDGALVPKVGEPKWGKAFGASSLYDSEGVPVVNRGSGIRRLVLMSFFRAQAASEQGSLLAADADSVNGRDIVIALEEPEMALHPDFQRQLVNSLLGLADESGQQVVFTTHSPHLVQQVPVEAIRHVRTCTGSRIVDSSDPTDASDGFLEEIQRSLGMFSDHVVKCFLLVEGARDIDGLHALTARLAADAATGVVDFREAERAGTLKIMPIGGCGAATLWSGRLDGLRRPQFVLLDSDRRSRGGAMGAGAKEMRKNGLARGYRVCVLTRREMENYLSTVAIAESLPAEYSDAVREGVKGKLDVMTAEELDYADIPETVAEAVYSSLNPEAEWQALPKDKRKSHSSRVKQWLAGAFGREQSLRESSDNDLLELLGAISSELQRG